MPDMYSPCGLCISHGWDAGGETCKRCVIARGLERRDAWKMVAKELRKCLKEREDGQTKKSG